MDELLYRKDAEQAVLGAILIDNSSIVDIATILKPEQVYDEANRAIYTAMCDLYAERVGIDVVPPLTSRRAVDLPSDFDVLVSVPALGWSERWAAPRAGDERTFTIPSREGDGDDTGPKDPSPTPCPPGMPSC